MEDVLCTRGVVWLKVNLLHTSKILLNHLDVHHPHVSFILNSGSDGRKVRTSLYRSREKKGDPVSIYTGKNLLVVSDNMTFYTLLVLVTVVFSSSDRTRQGRPLS